MKINKIETSEDVYSLVKKHAKSDHEMLIAILLTDSGEIIDTTYHTNERIDEIKITPGMIFNYALEVKAANIIVAHNHPSGGLMPSVNDFRSTEKLIEIGNDLEIKIMDHIIFSDKSAMSMRLNYPQMFEKVKEENKKNEEMEM